MKILYFLVFAYSLAVSAQPDTGLKGFSVPPAGNMGAMPSGSISSPSISSPSIFDSPRSSGRIEDKPLNSNFGKPLDFANPNEKYIKKLNPAEGEVDTAIRKNQYFGDFKTKSELAVIKYRDHGAFDGDLIRVLVNDVVVVEQILLETFNNSINLPLIPGFNKIEFEALNQGTSGPNTAEFEVYDDKGMRISGNRWNLATGFRATIILVRE